MGLSNLVLVFFVLMFSNMSFAVEDYCSTNCSNDCVNQVKAAEIEIIGHYNTCQGKDPGAAVTECGRACSFGCRNFMRGQRSIVANHYLVCGGGSGEYADLVCVEDKHQFFVMNTHTLQLLGAGHALSNSCEKTIETKNYTLFCAKTFSGYAVTSFVSGAQLGTSVPFLDQCAEFIDNIKEDHICVKVSGEQYTSYNIATLASSGKRYNFLSQCLESL